MKGDTDNDEKNLFDIIGKHFSVKISKNSSKDENKNLFDSFLKNIFKQDFENIKPVEVLIKQKFDHFVHSLELPNNYLTSFAIIINAMGKK
jgi:hypothetical protein